MCVQKHTNRAREKRDTTAQANHLCDLHVIVRSLSQLDDFVYDGSGNERAQVLFLFLRETAAGRSAPIE